MACVKINISSALVGAALLAGCGGGEEQTDQGQLAKVCTQQVVPGVVATIEDADTHQSIASSSVATLTDGSYTEKMGPYAYSSDGTLISLAGAGERIGDYSLTVHHDGYQDSVTNNILVQKGQDDCHVATDELSILLAPSH